MDLFVRNVRLHIVNLAQVIMFVPNVIFYLPLSITPSVCELIQLSMLNVHLRHALLVIKMVNVKLVRLLCFSLIVSFLIFLSARSIQILTTPHVVNVRTSLLKM